MVFGYKKTADLETVQETAHERDIVIKEILSRNDCWKPTNN